MIKKLILLNVLFFYVSISSQDLNLNSFKYIVVSDKFDFVKEKDGYQTSSLTKFLFAKKDFTVFLANESFPKELANERCLALFADVIDKSGMFSINLQIEMKDCYGKVVLTSGIGKSRIKEYQKGYHEAIRNAFETLTSLKFNGNSIASSGSTIEKSKEISENELPIEENKAKTVNQKEEIKTNNNELKAIGTSEGYYLLNDKVEVIFKLFKTSLDQVFIIQDKNGILYKTTSGWIAEYYEGKELKQVKLQINF